jgi:hypothetical protein
MTSLIQSELATFETDDLVTALHTRGLRLMPCDRVAAHCSAEYAPYVAVMLIRRSQWFEVTPLPDDVYEFAVKAENAALLRQLVTMDATQYPGLRPMVWRTPDDKED